ncbi:MAG: alpha/beta hydrolase [Puniceicoccales bacterium]|nr:alpha/beta hydrolase [Puniceicoccales bacterium]
MLESYDGSGENFNLGQISKKIVESISCDGVTHEKLKAIYEKLRTRALAMRRSAAKQFRERIKSIFRGSLSDPDSNAMQSTLRVQDYQITSLYDEAKIFTRFYAPEENSDTLLVYFHGGGWMQGSVQNDDAFCCKLTDGLKVCTLSVEYRLAPEHPFPVGLNDSVSSYVWAKQGHFGLFKRIYLCGESAGGNLAAASALKIYNEFPGNHRIDGQILLYPPLSANLFSDSYQRFGKGHLLTGELLQNFYYNYLGKEFEFIDKQNALIFPCSELDMTKFPKTFIITAGLDPLRSNGEEFAQKLRRASIPVEYYCFSEALHGFLGYHEIYKNEFSIALTKIKGWLS